MNVGTAANANESLRFGNGLDGTIDEARVYSRALTDDEAVELGRFTAFVDVSHLVRNGSQEHYARKMNGKRRSVVDSYAFRLKHDRDMSDRIREAEGRILCTVDEYGGPRVFTGWIAPTSTQRIGQIVDSYALEALDMSYLLDEPIAESFQFPAVVGDPGFSVLDSSSPSTSIVHQVLATAGYITSVDIAPDCPDILTTVESVAAEAGEETYREFLDDLLYEFGYVLDHDTSGRFTVYLWDRDTITPERTLSGDFGTNAWLEIRERENEFDGFEVEWSKLSTMSDVLLFRQELPISTTNGELEFTGTAIDDGDYYPPDSDIEDVYQRFRTRWLDTEYLARETRLRNKDLSLVNTSGHAVEFTADAGVSIATEEYEARRARVNFQNTSGEIAKLYTFDIVGDALYRSSIEETLVPSTARNPDRYTSRFIFEETHAARLATALSRLRRFGRFEYRFELREELEPGAIVQIYQSRDNLTPFTTTVVILERESNPQRPMNKYVAEAITAYSTESVVRYGTGTTNPVAEQRLNDALRETVPTYVDLDDGYDSPSGGTTTPAQPTLAAAGMFKAVRLAWERQENLTNHSHYELLVSDDGGTTWYTPVNDGNGVGAQDPGDGSEALRVDGEFFVHADLPLDGTAEDPIAKPYVYTLARVTKSGERSVWSEAVTATARATESGTIGKNAIFANNLRAGEIRTEHLDVDEVFGENAVFRGTLEATDGLFRGSIESGPLMLNISPPVTTSISTDGKSVRDIVDEILAAGVVAGTYECSGTVGGQDVTQIQFAKNANGPRVTSHVWHVWWTTGDTITTYWHNEYTEVLNQRVYTLRLFNGSTQVFGYHGSLVVSNGYWLRTASYQLGQKEPGEWGTSSSQPTEPTDYTMGDFSDGGDPGIGAISFTNGAFTMKLIQLPAFSSSLPQWSAYVEDDGSGNYNLKIKGS